MGIYEVLEFDATLIEMIRSDVPVSGLRTYFKERGGDLIGDHAIEKIKEGILTPKDVYEKVLVEDLKLISLDKRDGDENQTTENGGKFSSKQTSSGKKKILIVEDDPDTRMLLTRQLFRVKRVR